MGVSGRAKRAVSARNVAVFLALFLCLLPAVVVWTKIPTASYRNVFFYADIHVAESILATGHVPAVDTLNDQMSTYWGKISNRRTLPVFPMSIATFKLLTGLPINALYSFFPGYLLVGAAYYLFIKEFVERRFVAAPVAVAASISPGTRVLYSFSFSSTLDALSLLALLFLYEIVKNDRDGFVGSYQLLFSLVLLWQLYWYPPKYGILYGVLVILFLISLRDGWYRRLLLPVSVGTASLPVVFNLPVYQHYLNSSLSNLLSGKTAQVAASTTQLNELALPPTYFSVLPLFVLFPFGVVGGVVCLSSFVRRYERDQSHDGRFRTVGGPLILIAWGVTIVGSGLLYLSAGESWLLTRSYVTALPLMFVATAIGIEWVSNRATARTAVSVLVLLAVVSSSTFVLQATDPRLEIQTYQPGVTDAGDWVATHDPGSLVGDTKVGAAAVASGHHDFRYPRNGKDAKRLFYSSRAEEYHDYLRRTEADAVVLYEGMHRVGLHVRSFHTVPVEKSQYDLRVASGNTIYTNGEVVIVKPVPTRTVGASRQAEPAVDSSTSRVRSASLSQPYRSRIAFDENEWSHSDV